MNLSSHARDLARRCPATNGSGRSTDQRLAGMKRLWLLCGDVPDIRILTHYHEPIHDQIVH